jgi:glycerol-3-phosphate cytidylyltransferase
MIKIKIGIIAGSFDIIHPGYIHMFNEAKKYCDYLVIALQTDPTVERPNKCKPILSYEERKQILLSLKPVSEVIKYTTEQELEEILKKDKYHVRILGDDYVAKYATGQEYSNEIVYVNRSHGWSTTKYKKLIAESLNGEKSMTLSDQALSCLMVALQKSLMEQSDIVPVLKSFQFVQADDGTLLVQNPPTKINFVQPQ